MDAVDPLATAANVNTRLKEHHVHTSGNKSVAIEGRTHSNPFANSDC